MLQLEEAVALLREQVEPVSQVEEIPILNSSGRVLAEDGRAAVDQPPFPRSPLDGYAVRGKDTRGAGKDSPVNMKVVGKVYAGEVFSGSVGEMEAVRIMTGAPIPQGADTVIRQEDSDRGEGEVLLYRESSPVVRGRIIKPARCFWRLARCWGEVRSPWQSAWGLTG